MNLVKVAQIFIRITNAQYLSYFDDQIYITKWEENVVYCYIIAVKLIRNYQQDDIRGTHASAVDIYCLRY